MIALKMLLCLDVVSWARTARMIHNTPYVEWVGYLVKFQTTYQTKKIKHEIEVNNTKSESHRMCGNRENNSK